MTKKVISKTTPDYLAFIIISVTLFYIAKRLSFEDGHLAYSKIPIIILAYLIIIVIIGREYIKTFTFFDDKIIINSFFYLNETVIYYSDIKYVVFWSHVPNSGARVDIHLRTSKAGESPLKFKYVKREEDLFEYLKNEKKIQVYEK